MGNNCAPLVANLCLLCYGRDFVMSPPYNNQAVVIEAFKSTSRFNIHFIPETLIKFYLK